ncbi:hypothetical protein WAI453_010003 [Rhynchosporium graminicola]
MAPTMTAVSLLLLLFTQPILSQSTIKQITWAAVTYTYHGEKTPDFSPSTPRIMDLTPLGAQQLYDAGTGLRNRYIISMNISQDTIPIMGISVHDLDNGQLDVVSMKTPYVAASALAFMQGLYPPYKDVERDGEMARGEGGRFEYPLNGYQYPSISTLSELDFNHIWIAGQIDCNLYSKSVIETIISPAYANRIEDTQTYYSSFTDLVFPDRDSSTINYAYAWEVYEGALYQYKHNTTIQNSTSFTADDLAILRSLASEQQWTFNTPHTDDLINAVSGRTFAAKVLQRLNANIASRGVFSKLSLFFGTHEPFLAFFALSNLATGASGPQFNTLPDHGSTMTFELFSTQESSTPDRDASSENTTATITMPSPDQLSVRFLFRNGSAPQEDMRSYSLFGRGNSETVIPWLEFRRLMGRMAMTDALDWCRTCEAKTIFCEAFEAVAVGDQSGNGDGNSDGNGDGDGGSEPPLTHESQNGISATVGGVIGAAVAVALFLLLVAGLLCAGFRVEHRKRGGAGRDLGGISVIKRASSGSGSGNAGGFKGADRLESDTDLAIKSGMGAAVVRHERVGSWELGQSPNADFKHRSLDKEIESRISSERVVSGTDYGRRSRELERENPFVDPVRAVERV